MLFTDKEYYNMILAAYTKARKKTGTNYQILMEGDQLSVDQKRKNVRCYAKSKRRHNRIKL